MADAGQDVEEVLVAAAGVTRPVRGNERKALRAGEVEEDGVPRLLVADAVPLDLDVEAAGEERREAREELACRVGPHPLERAQDWPLESAREDVEPIGVRGDVGPRGRSLPLRLAERGGGEEVERVADQVFLLTPRGTEVSDDDRRRLREGGLVDEER